MATSPRQRSARHPGGALDFATLLEPAARALLGDPNKALSNLTKGDLRWGRQGSLAINTKKGQWFDHESQLGGGTLDLIMRELSCDKAAALSWMSEELGVSTLSSSPLSREAGQDSSLAVSARKASEPRSGEERFERGPSPSSIEATYDYRDADGKLAYQVVRYEPKTFRQRRPDGKGGWINNLGKVERLPFGLPELLASDDPVFITEGEKDAQALQALGLTATCNAGGAGKWQEDWAPFFEDRDIVILPDNDSAGQDHAEAIAAALNPVAQSLHVLSLPGLPEKGDVSDWLAADPRRMDADLASEDLRVAVDRAAPWTPRPLPPKPRSRFEPLDLAGLSLSQHSDYVIKGLIDGDSVGLIYAPPASYKSFLALSFGLHVAADRDWMDKRVQGGHVVYAAGEGQQGLIRRTLAGLKEYSIDNDVPFSLVPDVPTLFDPGEVTDFTDQVDQAAAQHGAPRMIILDTLSLATAGGDLNDNAATRDALRYAVSQWRQRWQCAVIFIHHQGKDSERGPLGATALTGNVDMVARVTPNDQGGVLSIEKMKDGDPSAQLPFAVRKVDMGEDQDGDRISTLVIDPGEFLPPATGRKLTDRQRIAYQTLVTLSLESGTPAPAEWDLPGREKIRTVPQSLWRERLEADGTLDTAADIAPEVRANRLRTAFNKLKESLITKGIVGLQERRVWAVDKS